MLECVIQDRLVPDERLGPLLEYDGDLADHQHLAETVGRQGYLLLGLDGEADVSLDDALKGNENRALALVLGAEGPGLRQKTKETCDQLVRIDFAGAFGSLNVSNAAAVSLYAATRQG